MAAEYPYTLATDALREFLGKLKKAGKPDKINKQYLASLGYTSSNHRAMPGVLRFIGLIDKDGNPTDKYQALRDNQRGPAMLAGFVRDAYSELFKVYPDAQRRDDEALTTFFRAHTDLGDRALSAIVGTFQVLCQFAAFDDDAEAEEKPVTPKAPEPQRMPAPAVTTSPIVVNVNLQLELPSTSDPEVYKALFSAMAEHIFFRLGKQ